MSEALDVAADVRAQFLLFGYAQTGPNEVSAIHAEHPGQDYGTLACAWDRIAADLRGQFVLHGDTLARRVKDWAALPWAGEHMLRGHEPWAGL